MPNTDNYTARRAERRPVVKKMLDNYYGKVNYSPNGKLSAFIWHAGCYFRLVFRRSHNGSGKMRAATETKNNNMQNYCKTIGAMAAASALVAGNALAGTPVTTSVAPSQPASAIEYDLHVGYSSMYLFRGQDLGDDLIEAGVNVKGNWNNIGLSAGAWYGSFDADNTVSDGKRISEDVQIDSDELDLYAEASYDLGFMTAAVGYIYYYYPQARSNKEYANLDNSQEVYFSLAKDFGCFKSSLTYFWDVSGADNDGYSELALSRSFELNSCLALALSTKVGYLVEQGQATAWTTKLALDWNFVGSAKLSPFTTYSVALSDDVDTLYNGSDNEWVGGAMLSVGF